MENIDPMNQDIYDFDVPVVENFEDENVDDFKWFSKRNSIKIRPGNAFPELTNEIGEKNFEEENELERFIDEKKPMTPLGEVINMAEKEEATGDAGEKSVIVIDDRMPVAEIVNIMETERVPEDRGEQSPLIIVINEIKPAIQLKEASFIEKISDTTRPEERTVPVGPVTPHKKGKVVASKANVALPHQKANLCRTEVPKKVSKIAEEGWRMATGQKTKRLAVPKPGKLPDLPEEKENHEPAKSSLMRCNAFLEHNKMPREGLAQPRLNLPTKTQTLGRAKTVTPNVGHLAKASTLPKSVVKPSTVPKTPHLSTMNRAMAKLNRMDSVSTASGSTGATLRGNVQGALPKESKPKFVQPKWK